MGYTILIVRKGFDAPEWKTYRNRSEFEQAKRQWKRLAKHNRKERALVFGEVVAALPQCQRGV